MAEQHGSYILQGQLEIMFNMVTNTTGTGEFYKLMNMVQPVGDTSWSAPSPGISSGNTSVVVPFKQSYV